MRVFDGYEVRLGHKVYRFKAAEVTGFNFNDGICRIMHDGSIVMAFNRWDSFKVLHVEVTV